MNPIKKRLKGWALLDTVPKRYHANKILFMGNLAQLPRLGSSGSQKHKVQTLSEFPPIGT